MLEKTPRELHMAKSHHTALAAVGIILPTKRDVSVGDLDKAMVGDRDSMGAASQILQYMFRPAEWSLRINHPILAE